MTMRNHPGDDALLDVAFGAAPLEAAAHVADCAECGHRVAEVRTALSMASEADAPEPSPLFWDAFRGRVASAIEAPPSRRGYAGFVLPAFLAAAATVAVIVYLPHETATAIPSPSASAWSSRPAVKDAPLDAVASTVSAEEIVGCRDVADCVSDLSDDESRAFADALRAELASSEDL
jgi:hypothetical protein